MSNFGILTFIFATSVLLAGLYMYTGHKIDMLSWKAPYQNLKINEWKNIGKYTMLTSIIIYILAIIGFIFKI